MNVFIVTENTPEWGGCTYTTIVGVSASNEEAEASIAGKHHTPPAWNDPVQEYYEIEEWEVRDASRGER